MSRLSLKSQIQLLILAAVIIVTTVLVTQTIIQFRAQFERSSLRMASFYAGALAETASPLVVSGDQKQLNSLAQRALMDRNIVGICLRDQNGKILTSVSDQKLPSSLSGFCMTDNGHHSITVDDGIIISRSIWSDQTEVAQLSLAVATDFNGLLIQKRIETILITAVFILLIMTVLGTWVAGRIVQPIETLREAAGCLSEGNFDIDLRQLGITGDFAPLAAAFIDMRNRLKTAFSELARTRDRLEDEVMQRTMELNEELTERCQAEVALKESEKLYRTLFECANDAIFIMQADRFIDCNARTLIMFGCTPEQIIGQPPYRFSPPTQPDGSDSREKAMGKINGALRGEYQFFEWRHCRYDNTPFEAEVSLTGLDAMGENYIIAIVRDITARKQAEQHRMALQEKLERAQRMESLGVLAGGVAHDLNNMLGPLVGYPDLMLTKLPEDSPLRRPIRRIGESAQQAANVIQDLLTLARRGRCDMIPVNLNEVISEYMDSTSFLHLAEQRPEIILKTDLCTQLPSINGSAPHLNKVIMNLVVNAYDAMLDGGTIEICTECRRMNELISGQRKVADDDYILLRVKDSGIGIPKDALPKIFEPYFSRKEMGRSGSGLGLSVVYGTVKDHRGFYDVFSEEGRGTEFVLYFPATHESVDSQTDESEPITGSESILIVDDVAEQRDIACELLQSLGFKTKAVENGHAAVEYLRETRCDLILLDMIMEPGFDGLDTYREILTIHPTQKALIVSGFSATDRVQEVLNLGAAGYVKKPYTMDVLGRAVRQALDLVPAEVV
ncbi:MAG TPA: response regulator [candidate division Zixibacteria bacterium]|nr:response regulator [candidate division Zixibacteria bacterium]